MFAFFRCVAEAVVEKGAKGLAGLVPGGAFAVGVAESAWRRYREKVKDAELRAELQKMAAATFDEAKAAAAEAVRDTMTDAAPEDRLQLELYLTQIPAAVKQSLKRPDDPTGLSVPPAFSLKSSDDVLKWLPPRVPKFRPGDPVPGKPGWVLVEQLGLGGFGEVWLARHPKFATLTGAIKFCHDLETRDRDLMHESGIIDRVMAAGRHPNIVPLLDANLDGDAPWLMYEYVPGGDLADAVRAWPGTKEPRVPRSVALLETLAEAVGHFHRLAPSVVHRDLKPSNILVSGVRNQESGVSKTGVTGDLLTPDARLLTPVVRITDFGISGAAARKMIEAESRGGATRGGRLLSYLRGSYTPLYASPQQRDGDDPDPRDDVHALGVIGYQMLTGNLSQGVGTDFVEDLREAHADEGLIELLRKCTAQKADRRPKDANELAERLRGLKTAPVAAPPPAPPPVVVQSPPPPVRPADTRKVKVLCPNCRNYMQCPLAYLGRSVSCPTCKGAFTAAELPAPTTSPRHFDITLGGSWHFRDRESPNWIDIVQLPGRVTVEPWEEYKVVGSGFGDDLAAGLKSLPRVPELKAIDVRWSSLLPANLDALDGFPALDELHLMSYLTDAELPRLAHLPVRTLNLLISPVGDAGLRTLGTFRTLEALDLSQCPNVTSAGIRHLVNLNNLRQLDLSETKIDDSAADPLAMMSGLAELNVSRTEMSNGTVNKIRAIRSGCVITANDLRGPNGPRGRR